MSVKSQQVAKPALVKGIPVSLGVKPPARGFAGNHTLMRNQSEMSDRSEFETGESTSLRSCACDPHTFGGGCDTCRKEGLSNSLQRSPIQSEQDSNVTRAVSSSGSAERLLVSQPNDSSEREADRVAHEVVRGHGGNLAKLITKGLHRHALSSKPQNGRHRNSQEGADDPFAPISGIAEVSPQTEEKIRKAVGSGRPLPVPLREFFEPRFGHDLGSVRVHTDQSAASTSQSLEAAAFTLGSDIFFNAGRFNPDTETGFGLVAHELTHVTQQQAAGAASRRLIQRAKINYGQLSWTDFKAQPPKGATEAAGVLSAFELPQWQAKEVNEKTKETCGGGLKKVKSIVSVDPAQFDTLVAYMDQNKSWVDDRFRYGAHVYCYSKSLDCESSFDTKFPAEAQRFCLGEVTKCEQEFNKGRKFFGVEYDGEEATAETASECATRFFKKCQKGTLKQFKFVLSEGAQKITAKTKGDCSKVFLKKCEDSEKVDAKLLLEHEQGHFEITHVLAEKAQASLKKRASELTTTETRCGQAKATEAAFESFDKNDNLNTLLNDWLALKEKAHTDYDLETMHSLNRTKQTDWEGKIKKKLKDYELPTTQPAPTPVTRTKTPATPTPTKPAAPKP